MTEVTNIMTPEEAAEYLEALGYTDTHVRVLSGGQMAWIHSIPPDVAILVMPSNSTGCNDLWYYESEKDALKALNAWNPEAEKEPTGWYRNPSTGRRRPNGNEEREYIEF